jgi:hypothetical protein
MVMFRYGLRAQETRRQYPRRTIFSGLSENVIMLEEQAKRFVTIARTNSDWAQESLM